MQRQKLFVLSAALGLTIVTGASWICLVVTASGAERGPSDPWYDQGMAPLARQRDPGYVPGTPGRVGVTSRPASWPSGASVASPGVKDTASSNTAEPGEAVATDEELDGAGWRRPGTRGSSTREGPPRTTNAPGQGVPARTADVRPQDPSSRAASMRVEDIATRTPNKPLEAASAYPESTPLPWRAPPFRPPVAEPVHSSPPLADRQRFAENPPSTGSPPLAARLSAPPPLEDARDQQRAFRNPPAAYSAPAERSRSYPAENPPTGRMVSYERMPVYGPECPPGYTSSRNTMPAARETDRDLPDQTMPARADRAAAVRPTPSSTPPADDRPAQATAGGPRPAGDGGVVGRGEIMARVGSDVILSSELGMERIRARALEKLRADNGGREIPPYQMEAVEAQLKEFIREPLKERINVRLIYQNATKSIPAENLPKVKEQIGKEFEKRQVPRMMAAAKVQSLRELEDKLAESGVSLEQQKREFIEQALASEWVRQQVKFNEEVTREEMLKYYHEHLADFERPARARWEQLTVRVAKYSSRAEAYSVLARMGNDVLRGTSLAEVAKARSDGPSASQGGVRAWTTQGSLVSKVLDKAIFGLPVGAMSPILEEDDAMHIVRVVEREDFQRTPFEETQQQIQEKFRKQREKQAREEFLARIRKETHVWTIFDEEPTTRQASFQLPIE